MATIDILIPTFARAAPLAITLTSLLSQTCRDYRVIVSDQSEDTELENMPHYRALRRVFDLHGIELTLLRHLPRRGMAEQRQFLLDQSCAPYVLYLDDDLVLETNVVMRLFEVMAREKCGFVGAAVVGLSFLNDIRPHEQAIEFWSGKVAPEQIEPNSPAWFRFKLHNAANLLHIERRLALAPGEIRTYKVAWVGGCVLFDREKLIHAGGYLFWPQLPIEHCGEDVLAQLNVMARFGGCGVIPSGVYHQELPSTVPSRIYNAPERCFFRGPGDAPGTPFARPFDPSEQRDVQEKESAPDLHHAAL